MEPIYFITSNINSNAILKEYILCLRSNFNDNNIDVKLLDCIRSDREGAFNGYDHLFKHIDENLVNQKIFVFDKYIIDLVIYNAEKRDTLKKNKTYFFNSEPYLKKFYKRHELILGYGFHMLEYYKGNIECINKYTQNKHVDNVHFLPFLYHKSDIINSITNVEKKYDVGMIFKPLRQNRKKQHDRRMKILNDFRDKGVNIININGFGEVRDNLIMQCKIIINLRSHDTVKDNRESLRVDRIIPNKIIVISEKIKYTGQYNDKFIIFVDYSYLVGKTINVLSNFEHFYNKIYGKYDVDKLIEENKSIIAGFA